jgi:hypothetical protein
MPTCCNYRATSCYSGLQLRGVRRRLVIKGDRVTYLYSVHVQTAINPVRARIVADAAAWAWSSYRAMIGLEPGPPWLETDSIRKFERRGRLGKIQITPSKASLQAIQAKVKAICKASGSAPHRRS